MWEHAELNPFLALAKSLKPIKTKYLHSRSIFPCAQALHAPAVLTLLLLCAYHKEAVNSSALSSWPPAHRKSPAPLVTPEDTRLALALQRQPIARAPGSSLPLLSAAWMSKEWGGRSHWACKRLERRKLTLETVDVIQVTLVSVLAKQH